MLDKTNRFGRFLRVVAVLPVVAVAIGIGASAASAQEGRALGKKSEITGKGRATAEEAKKGGLRLGRDADKAEKGKRDKAERDAVREERKMRKERDRAQKRMDKEKRKSRY